jgi:hypothetical protein
MATDTVDGVSSHIRGITVTTLASVVGILAAVASTAIASGPKDNVGLYLLVGAIIVQLPVLRLLGIEVNDFSTKDYLYIGFMTFAMWFIAYSVLLTAESAALL